MFDIFLFISSFFLTILSFPPFYLWFFSFFSLVPLFFLVQRRKSGFKVLFLWALFFNLYHLHWIIFLSKIVPEVKYLLPIGLIFLSIIESLFFGIIGIFIKKFLDRKYLFIIIPFLFAGLEYFKTLGEIAFPWSPFFLTQVKNIKGIQIIEFTGPFFLTLYIIFMNLFVYKSFNKRNYFYLFIFLFLINQFYGGIRIAQNFKGEKIKVAVYQPNLALSLSYKEEKENGFKTYTELSKVAKPFYPFLSVFPESALPGFLKRDYETMEFLKNFALENNTYIFLGSADYELLFKKIGKRRVKIFNAVFLISPSGEITDKYYKNILVPFGEAIPYDEKLSFLQKINFGEGDYSRGKELKVFNLNNLKAGTLICFESIFPELSRKIVQSGAQVLINLTSDGWFGKSLGPLEHRDLFTFRAVETRRFLLRSARMGISCIIDPYGRILEERSLFTKGIIIKDIIIPSQEQKTFYVRYGDITGKISFFILFFLLIVSLYNTIIRRKKGVSQ